MAPPVYVDLRSSPVGDPLCGSHPFPGARRVAAVRHDGDAPRRRGNNSKYISNSTAACNCRAQCRSAAPDYDAARVAVIPQGAEVELTAEAAPGFLGVYYDGQVVWVPAQYVSLGVRPGIDTGVTVANTPLLDAPMRDAPVLEIILEGESVILPGANVDGYDAASHDCACGWIDERDLSR